MHEYNHHHNYLCFDTQIFNAEPPFVAFEPGSLHICSAGWLVACVIKDKLKEINHCCVGAQSCRSAKFYFVN